MNEALRNQSFRRVLAAGLMSKAGSEISRLGFFLYLFHTRDSISDLALLVALKTLPGALVAPVAGWVADRFDKRRILIVSDLIQVALLLVIMKWPAVGIIYMVAGLQSVVDALFEPAKRAAIPLIVHPRQLASANGLDQSSSHLMMIFGPLIGAELFVYGGLYLTLVVDAASFLCSALLLSQVVIRPAGSGAPIKRTSSADVWAGWVYLSSNPRLLYLVFLLFIGVLCGGIWVPLAPFFIRDFLAASDHILGLQLAVFGLGGVLGGFLATRLSRRLRYGVLLLIGLTAEGLQIIAYSVIPVITASCLIIFLWGIAVSTIQVTSHSILQTTVQPRLLGRVFSIINQSENLAMVLAMGLAILLKSTFAIPVIFLSAGLVYVLSVVVTLLSREGRSLLLHAGAKESPGGQSRGVGQLPQEAVQGSPTAAKSL